MLARLPCCWGCKLVHRNGKQYMESLKETKHRDQCCGKQVKPESSISTNSNFNSTSCQWTWEGSRGKTNYMGACHSGKRPGWSFRLLGWLRGQVRVNQRMENHISTFCPSPLVTFRSNLFQDSWRVTYSTDNPKIQLLAVCLMHQWHTCTSVCTASLFK